MDAAQVPPEKQRAGGMVLDMGPDWRAKTARHRCRVEWFQTSEPSGCEIAGNTTDAEAIGTVRRHLDIKNGLGEPRVARILGPDRRVLRQLDDTLMILAETKLIGRAQHAARGDATDHGFFEQCTGARNDGSGRGEHALHPGMGVWRTTHDLNLGLAGIDDANL